MVEDSWPKGHAREVLGVGPVVCVGRLELKGGRESNGQGGFLKK